MTPALQLAPAQAEVIATIRKTLKDSEYQHVRVIGEPGIGKTRLVLEALSTDDLAPTVIYSPHAEDFQRSQLFNELLRGELHYHATVIIDECAAKERASIWGVLKGKRHIRLVTIDHGPENSRDDQMLVIDCPRLSEEQIMAIIGSYLPKPTGVWHWAEWCSGSCQFGKVADRHIWLITRVFIRETFAIDQRVTIATGLLTEDIERINRDHQALPYFQTQDASGLAVDAWMEFECVHCLHRDDCVKRPADDRCPPPVIAPLINAPPRRSPDTPYCRPRYSRPAPGIAPPALRHGHSGLSRPSTPSALSIPRRRATHAEHPARYADHL